MLRELGRDGCHSALARDANGLVEQTGDIGVRRLSGEREVPGSRQGVDRQLGESRVEIPALLAAFRIERCGEERVGEANRPSPSSITFAARAGSSSTRATPACSSNRVTSCRRRLRARVPRVSTRAGLRCARKRRANATAFDEGRSSYCTSSAATSSGCRSPRTCRTSRTATASACGSTGAPDPSPRRSAASSACRRGAASS